MPRRRSQRSFIVDDSSDIDESQISQRDYPSLLTQSISQPPTQNASIDILLVKKFVKYILNNCYGKIPIKRPDIVANVLGGNSKSFPRYLTEAEVMLKQIYGLKIVQIPSKTPQQFIIAPNFDVPSELVYTEEQHKHLTLLFLVLSLIFMLGGSVTEDVLHQFLKKFGIEMDESLHEYFGNVKKLLTETYVKQQYLKREKRNIEGSNQEEILISWGFRSTLEVSKVKMLEIVANFLGKPTQCFAQQYDEVHQSEMQVDVDDPDVV